MTARTGGPPLGVGIVAVPLLSLFNRTSGTGRFDNREEMLAFFKLSPATRVIVTSGQCRPRS